METSCSRSSRGLDCQLSTKTGLQAAKIFERSKLSKQRHQCHARASSKLGTAASLAKTWLPKACSLFGAAIIALLLGFAAAIPTAKADPKLAAPPARTSTARAHELTPASLEKWLDGFLVEALRESDIAGAVVVVVKDGKIFFQKGYGHAVLAARIPMDPQYHGLGIASVSKLLTWTAVMQLVEQGKLDLDRDINTYLDVKIPRAFGRPILLRHLMTHTAGFAERMKGYLKPGAPPYSLARYMREVPPPNLISAPGEIPAYSNYGTELAGYIVERVSGEPIANYISSHILQPLGMRQSSFCKPLPPAIRATLAKGYGTASSAEPVGDDANSGDLVCSPAGDMVTTGSDISRFMLAHLQRGRYGNFQLLRPDTADLMHKVAFAPMPGAQGTALGFFRSDYNGRRILSHGGDGTGFHTDLQLVPEEGVGFFLSVNSDGTGSLLGGAYKVRASVFHSFMDRYFPAPAHAPEPTLATAKEHAAIAAGEYELSRPRQINSFVRAFYLATHISITANPDGTIETPSFLSLKTGRPQTWREVEPFIWREVDGNDRLIMKVKDGRVESWVPGSMAGFVLLPVPSWASGAVNLPLFAIAAAILLLTSVAWPIMAFVRRRSAVQSVQNVRERRVRFLAYLGAVVATFFLLGWVALFGALAVGGASLNADLDPWIRLVQFIGLLCVVGAAAALWNAWQTCVGTARWWTKLWSVVLAIALLDFVWFSFVSSLISSNLNY